MGEVDDYEIFPDAIRLISMEESEFWKMSDELASLRTRVSELEAALERIRDDSNCHREFSDDEIRKFPDVSCFCIIQARRFSSIAAEALRGKK